MACIQIIILCPSSGFHEVLILPAFLLFLHVPLIAPIIHSLQVNKYGLNAHSLPGHTRYQEYNVSENRHDPCPHGTYTTEKETTLIK